MYLPALLYNLINIFKIWIMSPALLFVLVVSGYSCALGTVVNNNNKGLTGPDMGNWTVNNCIVVKMAGKVKYIG